MHTCIYKHKNTVVYTSTCIYIYTHTYMYKHIIHMGKHKYL